MIDCTSFLHSQDAKFIARRYEEYATETIDDISRHFIYLHGVLQSIERNVLLQVKDHATRFLSKIQQSQSALKKGQEAFEDILNTLEGTMTQPPANYTVGNIVERTNSILESTPCNVEFSGVNSNPFLFVGLTTDFPNLYALEVVSQDLPPRIHTYFGDTSSMERSTQSSQRNNSNIASSSTNRAKLFPSPPRKAVQPQQKGKNKKSKNKKASVEDTQSINSTDRNILSMPNTSFGLKNATAQKVHVSHIKNPENFYVQVQKFLTIENSLDKCITEEAEFAPSPDYIDSGEIYLVFNGANQTWYRGEVLNGSPSEFYKVFLVDFGNSIQVPKQRFRVISETLKSKPYGAIQCSLYGVKPIKNEWNDRANQLMSEIIMNEIVSMIVYKEDTICQVDLITTHLTYPTSVRNALIFAELAVDDPNLPTEMQKRVQQLSNVRKSLLTPPTEKFYKSVFKEGESFRGIVLNVNDPHDFYAIKYDHNGVMDNLYEELNKDYQQPQQKLFTPLVNTPCAVYLDERWHRAKITKISSKANCTVWLVDKAQSQTVPYTQLRTLQPKFLSINECAFQCSLTDIEPHQKFGYAWTPSAIAEFKRIIQNPVLQIIVHRTQNFLHQVCLYIIKKDLDVNVNALLVKYKHANSTGPESQYVEYPKLNDLAKVDDDILNEINLMEMQINDVKKPAGKVRSKVKICHIVSPGEFYLTKVENQVAISKFHEEIQLSRSKDEVAPAKPYENVIDDDDLGAESKWKIGNYCLAKLRLKKDSSLQWYRAVITEIIEGDNGSPKYTVFLRDHGKTFQDIPSEQVAPIPGVYNRVCDGAIKCFLACIQPTGGLSTWSGSSIDEFKLITTKFENLAASIQGECQGDSIPVILWGLKQECTDPLAPTVYKWVNINKYLSNSGLVHLVEKFAPITEKNALNTDVPEGGESFNEWLKNLNTTVDRTLKETGQITILKHDTDFDISQEEAVIDTDEGEEFVTWLPAKENTKTVFMGIPTFVDNDGVIYLYDAAKKQVFDNISIVVNKVVKSTKPTTDSFWYVGQPCLAQYNIDGKFYRAVILETKPDRRVSVQFVDYGNVQECSVKDLRKQVVLTQIPIQVTKYRLDGIIPSGGKAKFSLTDLDFLYANIVNKQCAVRVSPNQQSEEIKLCSMKCGPIDIAELLIESGFACKSRQTPIGSPFLDAVMAVGKRTARKARAARLEKQRSKETTEDDELDKKHEEVDEKSDDEDIIIEAILEEKPASKNSRDGIELDVDNYQELFEKIDLDNLKTLGRNFSDDNSDYDGREAESTYKPIYCRHVANDNASDESDGEGLVKDIDEDENMALIDQAAADTTPSSLDTKDMSTSTKLTKGKKRQF
ncbi:unnamed protein product [Hermetia illucens]|uniref:Tudor domain-containing protein n=1 Tax=Hermetia illucens TaxID=343691 RepID=A0A7R8YVH3_HERIL|nr:unnamed protein product [Hermetia illucens]